MRAGGKAVGVRLEGRGSRGADEGAVIRARRGVVSNASVWDTQALLPAEGTPSNWRREALGTPRTGSFMHLHLGGERSPPLFAIFVWLKSHPLCLNFCYPMLRMWCFGGTGWKH